MRVLVDTDVVSYLNVVPERGGRALSLREFRLNQLDSLPAFSVASTIK